MSGFSHIIEPDTIGGKGKTVALRPDEAVAAEIAKRLDLVELRGFEADIDLLWEDGGTIFRLNGELRAKVVQKCVVSLQPVESEIDYPFVERFAAEADGDESEIVITADQEADVDILPADGLDVGEIAIQHLSLALDPYPRATGAEASGPSQVGDFADEALRPNPFARLSVLKGGKT